MGGRRWRSLAGSGSCCVPREHFKSRMGSEKSNDKSRKSASQWVIEWLRKLWVFRESEKVGMLGSPSVSISTRQRVCSCRPDGEDRRRLSGWKLKLGQLRWHFKVKLVERLTRGWHGLPFTKTMIQGEHFFPERCSTAQSQFVDLVQEWLGEMAQPGLCRWL